RSNTVSVLLGNGDGTFEDQVTAANEWGPDSLAAVDVNGDGRTDLVAANSGSDNASILLNVGNGFFASAASAYVQTVNQAGSATSLSSSANASVFGRSVAFTAPVAAVGPGAGVPTGTVTFKDGATALGTALLVSKSATLQTSALGVGTHP